MEIRCDSDVIIPVENIDLSDDYLVPVGGGKDSVVTLELLRNTGKNVLPFIINPRGATLNCAYTGGYTESDIFSVTRSIDPLLLKLNDEGYLNGHTPFSAMLAFTSILASLLSGCKNVALSNESSANESTVADSYVNHQYSKSFAFEKGFREYYMQYITPSVNYFSFLRPLNELQIASLFAGFTQYHQVFRSCNAGSKTDSWCGNCPKCLFVFTILSPFVKHAALCKIFGKDLFSDVKLTGFLDELTGMTSVKPFECVGTVNEVNAALQYVSFLPDYASLPLIMHFMKNVTSGQTDETDLTHLMKKLEPDHFLNASELNILKEILHV